MLSCEATPEFVKSLDDGLYAHIDTDKGAIVLELFYERAPLTVSNFVGLTKGILRNDHVESQPFYNGLMFHRVVDSFVIQGGDPLGNGSGGPGYSFPDEFHPELRHDKKGILSMANSGANTNGSQFFITMAETPWLDDKHSVFGEIVLGMDVVESIAETDIMNSVTIIPVGSDAEVFQVTQESFDALVETGKEEQKLALIAQEKAVLESIKERWPSVIESKEGLWYEILTKGSGKPPSEGSTIVFDYVIQTMDGTTIDTTYREDATSPQIVFKQNRLLQAWELSLAEMQPGEERRIISPPELSFGSNGFPGYIGPNEYVYYEIKLVEVQ